LTKSRRKPTYLTLMHRFQDLVNRTPWNTLRFSNDGEFVIGGAGHKAAHQIYLWDNTTGSLSKILEGPKDPLEDLDVSISFKTLGFISKYLTNIADNGLLLRLQWHPVKPICVSVSSDQGLLHIWTTNITERWSAYAPGFEELEENLEYQEREDEFDAEDENEVEKRKLNVQDIFVDIAEQDTATKIPLPPSHAGDKRLRDYLASSDAWADMEPDGDERDDFAIPIDVDLLDFDIENTDVGQIVEADTGR
jgi:COMPASS component SWD1